MSLHKPTYYLWRTNYVSQEEFESDREKYVKNNFRVVTFLDGEPDRNIHDGIKTLIKNHIEEINS